MVDALLKVALYHPELYPPEQPVFIGVEPEQEAVMRDLKIAQTVAATVISNTICQQLVHKIRHMRRAYYRHVLHLHAVAAPGVSEVYFVLVLRKFLECYPWNIARYF